MTKDVEGLIGRVLVATDGSATADKAVRWAAALATSNDAELVLVRVLLPTAALDDEATVDTLTADLGQLAVQFAGPKGTARLVVDEDPARSIVRVAVEERADLIVVGSVGMAGRKKFLLGNVPNRVSHMSGCSVVIVKTDHDSGGATEEPSQGSSDNHLDRAYLVARARDIGRIVRKHHLTQALREPPRTGEARRVFGQRLRLALDELGPTFAKIGQMLSTRPDLLPPEIIDELATLQDHVSPLTEEQVVAMMEAEWGVPWEDVLDSIQPQPLAAGTIAQVHRATLVDGTRVVVKVQRPSARADIERDLELLHTFARRAEKRAAINQVADVAGVLEHVSKSLTQELDFRKEAENIERMRGVLRPYPRLGVPEVFTDLSTSRVLVMEEIAGLPADAAPAGVAREETAHQLLESYFHQLISVGFFHADPHPGNLIWRDGQLYFLDFGMVGEIDDGTRELLLLLFVALWRNDPELLAEVALLLGGGEAQVGPGFERELGELLARYHDTRLADIQFGVVLQEMTQTALRHQVRLPSTLVLVSKALAQMQLAVAGLDPTLDPIAAAGPYIARMLLRNVRDELDPKQLVSDFLRFRTRAARLMEALELATGARPGLRPEIRVQGSKELETSVRQAGQRVALGLALAGALVAVAIRRSPRHRIGG